MKKSTKFSTMVAVICVAMVSTSAVASGFEGPYVGITLAMDHFNAEETYKGGTTNNGNASFDGVGADGANFGGIVGYEKQFGSNLIGIEANFDWSGAKATHSGSPVSSTLKAERTLGLSLRLGRILSKSTLLYGKLGWVNTNFDLKAGTSVRDEDLDGFVFGAGIEFALDEVVALDGIKIRAEYTFTDYEDADIFINRTANEVYNVDPSRGQFLVSVRYNF